METAKIAGRDYSIDSLLADDYQAVFLATGGWDSRQASENKDLIQSPVNGFYLLIDLLNKKNLTCGDQVVIIGGRAVAGEAIEACKQAGAGRVTLLTSEPETGAETDAVTDLGGEIVFNTAVDRLSGVGKSLESVTCTDLTTGAGHTVPARTILFAAGRFPELVFSRRQTEEKTSPDTQATTPVAWQATPVYKDPASGDQAGIFVPGDPVTDFDAAIKAIGAGRRAAAAIHMVMYGDPMCLPDRVLTRNTIIQSVSSLSGVGKLPRNIMPLRDRQEIEDGLELEAGFSERIARDEAARCLQCGLICYEKR